LQQILASTKAHSLRILDDLWQSWHTENNLDNMLYKYNNTYMSYDSRSPGRSGVSLFNRIAVLRAERGLSRTALADALDINYQTVGYIERGDFNPSLELAFRISEYFDLPIEAIFSRKAFRPLSEEVYGNRNSLRRSSGK